MIELLGLVFIQFLLIYGAVSLWRDVRSFIRYKKQRHKGRP